MKISILRPDKPGDTLVLNYLRTLLPGLQYIERDSTMMTDPFFLVFECGHIVAVNPNLMSCLPDISKIAESVKQAHQCMHSESK